MATLDHTPAPLVPRGVYAPLSPESTLTLIVHGSTFEGMSNEDLIALLEEPETLASLSPLERELLVRLGAMLDVLDYTDAEHAADLARM